MINVELFNTLIDELKLCNNDLSLKTGIPVRRIASIRAGVSEPNAKEIQAFSESLEFTDRKRRAVFFNRKFPIRLQHGVEAS